MIVISDIICRQILDSRGNPTVEVDIVLSDGVIGRSSVPSGASKGKYEALELRDNSNSYYGLSVKKALNFEGFCINMSLKRDDFTFLNDFYFFLKVEK